MTDPEYLFKQTEIERKRIARGDKNKKRGGGRYVRLPSDHLTKKEREAMNGEVKTWKDKPFYRLNEFVDLPDDVKLKWINSLINRYGCGMGGICGVCFPEKTTTWLNHHMHAAGLAEYVNKSMKGKAATKAVAALRKDYEYYMATQVTCYEEPDGEIAATQNDQQPEANHDVAYKQEIRTEYGAIAELLKALAGSGARLTIEVTL